MEKEVGLEKEMGHAAHSISSTDDERENRQIVEHQWHPGFVARFPWVGFGALAVVLVCVVASVVVLVTSNGRSQTHWPQDVAPNVLLSIFNNVANICFSVAIGEHSLSHTALRPH